MGEPSGPRTDLRARVRAGEVTFGAFAALSSPISVELMGRSGLDWVILDLEHSPLTETDLLAGIYALQTTRATALVRVEESTRLRIGRALDFGAEGLMIPRLETPAEVRASMHWLRFPPAGIRGIALSTRGAGMSDVAHEDVQLLNARPLGIFQIESPLAVANAAEIAAIDGVDVLFVGPTDLSHAMGIPGAIKDPAFIAALETVARACADHGKSAGILLRGAADVSSHLAMGYRFLGIGSDGAWVRDGARAAVAAARAASA
ncbi:MAG: HpcH/HpaI aldolase/citrate lyase family protein [Candidatus Limnocylindrales bacterium]